MKICQKIANRSMIFGGLSCAKESTLSISKNAENAPTLAIVAVHTAENEPLKVGVIYSVNSFTSLVTRLALLLLGASLPLKTGDFSGVYSARWQTVTYGLSIC